MGRSLVIVESPAKAKTINKYLGKEYIVKSSVGHIRDLPKGGSTPAGKKKGATLAEQTKGMSDAKKAAFKKKRDSDNLIRRMGINPESGWAAQYEILPGKEKVVAELQKLAASGDKVYLATDLDREGEAIAWHLKEVIGGEDDRFERVTFNEITKTAIQEAFKHPQSSMSIVSMRSRPDAFSTVLSASWSLHYSGQRLVEGFQQVACNRLPFA